MSVMIFFHWFEIMLYMSRSPRYPLLLIPPNMKKVSPRTALLAWPLRAEGLREEGWTCVQPGDSRLKIQESEKLRRDY